MKDGPTWVGNIPECGYNSFSAVGHPMKIAAQLTTETARLPPRLTSPQKVERIHLPKTGP